VSYIADLAPVSYSGLKGPIRAVGWLESPHPFPRGSVDPRFDQRLKTLIEHPVGGLFSLGMYWCSICEAEGTCGPDFRSSQSILLVPAPDCVYETPIWIGHYVFGHSYKPPVEFCRAVLSCPQPGSDAFQSALVAHVPELSRLEQGGFPFFAKIDAQWTLRPCAENGSEERWRATRKNAPDYGKLDWPAECNNDNPMALIRRFWRHLTKR
jgi:hypothetical protein